MLLDVRTAFVTREGFAYVPMNYDRAFHGPVLARDALAGSLNLPAVLALEHVGLPVMLRLAGRLGLDTLADADRFGLSLTLGGGEVRLLDLAAAYGAFANGGRRVDPALILEVRDARGRLIERWQATPGERVLDERVAFLITDILADNNARGATFGFNSVLQIGRPAAAKTGTTTDYRDNWTLGYTPELVAGVWVGNANNSPMVNLSGVAGAGPIWHDFMREALAGKPVSAFTPPAGLERAEVCVPSGLRPTPLCPRTRPEWFLAGTAPTLPDTLYQALDLDARTGALADAATPPEAVVRQIFMVVPPEAREWAAQAGLPQPPATANTADAAAALALTAPDPGTVYQLTPRLPATSQRIPLRVVARQPMTSVTYYINGAAVGAAASPFEVWWTLTPGLFRLEARGELPTGEITVSAPLEFTVLP